MRLLDQRRAQASAHGWTTARWLQTILLVLIVASGVIVAENHQVTQGSALLDRLGDEGTALGLPPAGAGSSTPEQRALSTLLAAPSALDPPAIEAITAAIEEAGVARQAHDGARLSAALQRLDAQVARAREASQSARLGENEQAIREANRRLEPHRSVRLHTQEVQLLVLSGAQIYLALVTRRLLSPPLLLASMAAMTMGVNIHLGASEMHVLGLTTAILALSAFGLWRRWREVS